MSDELGPFLEAQKEQGETESSGKFTVELGRAGRLLAAQALADPSLAVLKAVQGAVAGGAVGIKFWLRKDEIEVRIGRPQYREVPVRSPDHYLDPARSSPGALPLSLALWSWHQQGAERIECRWFHSEPSRWVHSEPSRWVDLTACFTEERLDALPTPPGGASDLGLKIRRKVTRAQVEKEVQLLQESCRFCPVPVQLRDEPVQPGNLTFQDWSNPSLLPGEFHLAEFYQGGEGSRPGIAILRRDWQSQSPGLSVNSWLETSQTLYRETSGWFPPVRWRYPLRVAGMVARYERRSGVLCQGAAFLQVEAGRPSQAVAVQWGVVTGTCELDARRLPGVTLVFDATSLPSDLSGLSLVRGEELKEAMRAWEERLVPWLQRFAQGMMPRLRSGSAFGWQTRRELSVILGIFGLSVGTGLSAFFPLPFLGLPWLIWYHGSRAHALKRLQERCQEISRAQV